MDHKASDKTKHMQPKKAAVVIGRFNPPTLGHYAVFNKAKKFVRDNDELGLDPVIIVVVVNGEKTREDKERNPLNVDERVAFMNGSGLANGVKFLTAKNALDALYEVRRAGYEPIAVATGSDRGDSYLNMLDKYFKDGDEPIDHYSIEIDRTEESSDEDKGDSLNAILQHVDSSMPVHMISASLARQAVKNDELDKFAIITGLSSKKNLAKLMFDKVKASMSKETE